MTDDEVTAEMAREMSTLGGCEFHFAPASMLRCVGLLQLAARHPALTEDDLYFIATFVGHARAYFGSCPTVLEVITRGADPSQDTTTLMIQCPLCEWSARNEVDGDPDAAARINVHLRRAFVAHVERNHSDARP